jgi:hypothetical protein
MHKEDFDHIMKCLNEGYKSILILEDLSEVQASILANKVKHLPDQIEEILLYAFGESEKQFLQEVIFNNKPKKVACISQFTQNLQEFFEELTHSKGLGRSNQADSLESLDKENENATELEDSVAKLAKMLLYIIIEQKKLALLPQLQPIKIGTLTLGDTDIVDAKSGKSIDSRKLQLEAWREGKITIKSLTLEPLLNDIEYNCLVEILNKPSLIKPINISKAEHKNYITATKDNFEKRVELVHSIVSTKSSLEKLTIAPTMNMNYSDEPKILEDIINSSKILLKGIDYGWNFPGFGKNNLNCITLLRESSLLIFNNQLTPRYQHLKDTPEYIVSKKYLLDKGSKTVHLHLSNYLNNKDNINYLIKIYHNEGKEYSNDHEKFFLEHHLHLIHVLPPCIDPAFYQPVEHSIKELYIKQNESLKHNQDSALLSLPLEIREIISSYVLQGLNEDPVLSLDQNTKLAGTIFEEV